MSKILIGVFSGVFVGAVVYELIKRSNPQLIVKLQDLAVAAVDELSGVCADDVRDQP
jgi:hypothetical protein